jgi:hypothetical protein
MSFAKRSVRQIVALSKEKAYHDGLSYTQVPVCYRLLKADEVTCDANSDKSRDRLDVMSQVAQASTKIKRGGKPKSTSGIRSKSGVRNGQMDGLWARNRNIGPQILVLSFKDSPTDFFVFVAMANRQPLLFRGPLAPGIYGDPFPVGVGVTVSHPLIEWCSSSHRTSFQTRPAGGSQIQQIP